MKIYFHLKPQRANAQNVRLHFPYRWYNNFLYLDLNLSFLFQKRISFNVITWLSFANVKKKTVDLFISVIQ